MIKNIRQRCKQIWTHCFSVVTYDVVSYFRFLNTDPGTEDGRFESSAYVSSRSFDFGIYSNNASVLVNYVVRLKYCKLIN
jgi:hypothetical protein